MTTFIRSLLYSLLLMVFLQPVLAQPAQKHSDAILLEYYQTQRYADAFNYLQSIYKEPITDNKIMTMLAYTANMSGKLPQAEIYYNCKLTA